MSISCLGEELDIVQLATPCRCAVSNMLDAGQGHWWVKKLEWADGRCAAAPQGRGAKM